MSRIKELIEGLCPNGVEYKAIKDCVMPIDKIQWNMTDETYFYIDLSSVSRDNHMIEETIEINKDNAPSRAQQIVRFNDILLRTTRPMLKRYCQIPLVFDNHICSTGFCVLRANNAIVLTRWLYHIISTTVFFDYIDRTQHGSSYPAILDKEIKAFEIPVPPLAIQDEIVRILDSFTELTAELTAELSAELSARKQQYEFYWDSVLSFDNTVEHKPIDSVFDIRNGYTPSKKQHEYWKNGNIPWFRMDDIRKNGRILKDSLQHITPAGVKGKLFEKDSIILATTATIGEHALIIADSLANQRFTNFTICKSLKDKLLPKYVFYYFFKIDNWCKENTRVSSFPSVDMDRLKKLAFPIPSLSEQKRIVTILDRFDTLCNSLTNGLPAEIVARKKQYEYYRDKLLTFNAK